MEAELQVSFAPDLRKVPEVRGLVRAFGRASGLPPRNLDDLSLALTELCNNAIEHGGEPAGPVGVSLALRDERVVLRVAWRGKGSATELRSAFRAAQSPPEAWSERGRGLFLVRAVADRVEVRRLGDGRLEVRLTKRR